MEEEKEITNEEYCLAKEIVLIYEKQFWNRYAKMISEIDAYFSSNLVCGQKIDKYEVIINAFHQVYILPIEPRFTRFNFIPPKDDKKAKEDIENIGKKYNGWDVYLSYKN
jgi:hypothetical protein